MGSRVGSGGEGVPERPWLWEPVTPGTEARVARWDHPSWATVPVPEAPAPPLPAGLQFACFWNFCAAYLDER